MSRYPATCALGAFLLLTLTACSDPKHGAWKVKSGVWIGSLLLLTALISAALVAGAISYKVTRHVLVRRRYIRRHP